MNLSYYSYYFSFVIIGPSVINLLQNMCIFPCILQVRNELLVNITLVDKVMTGLVPYCFIVDIEYQERM